MAPYFSINLKKMVYSEVALLLQKIKMLQIEFQKIRLIKYLLIKNILRMLIIYLIGFLDNEKRKKVI